MESGEPRGSTTSTEHLSLRSDRDELEAQFSGRKGQELSAWRKETDPSQAKEPMVTLEPVDPASGFRLRGDAGADQAARPEPQRHSAWRWNVERAPERRAGISLDSRDEIVRNANSRHSTSHMRFRAAQLATSWFVARQGGTIGARSYRSRRVFARVVSSPVAKLSG